MSQSDTDRQRDASLKTAFRCLLVSLLTAAFGAIYEYFSHGVYSYFMIYAFAFPLAGGALPFAAMALSGRTSGGGALRTLYDFGIAFLTVGSIVQGVLNIYGTTNRLTVFYWIAGAALMVPGIVRYILRSAGEKRKQTINEADPQYPRPVPSQYQTADRGESAALKGERQTRNA